MGLTVATFVIISKIIDMEETYNNYTVWVICTIVINWYDTLLVIWYTNTDTGICIHCSFICTCTVCVHYMYSMFSYTRPCMQWAVAMHKSCYTFCCCFAIIIVDPCVGRELIDDL